MRENIIFLVVVALVIGTIVAGYFVTDLVTGNGVSLW